MKKAVFWIKAARLKLHVLGILPVLIGSLLAFKETGSFNFINFLFTEFITLTVLIATAFANDYADVETDKRNKNFNMFSGGSRAIADGFISEKEMLAAAVLITLVSVILSVIFSAFFLHNPLVIALTLAGLVFGIGYSLSPLKINYRGSGELFVMVMYGLFCVYFGYMTQGSYLFVPQILYFSIPIGIITFSMILITELPDYESDKLSGKKTIPVIFGREASLFIYSLGIILLYISILALYLFETVNRMLLIAVFLSLPLAVFIFIRSLPKQKFLSENIFVLCIATLMLTLYVNIMLSLNLILPKN